MARKAGRELLQQQELGGHGVVGQSWEGAWAGGGRKEGYDISWGSLCDI